MTPSRIFSRYGEAFTRLFYPAVCALCEKLLELSENGLCQTCLRSFLELRLAPSQQEIQRPLRYGEEAWTAFRYDGPVKKVLHRIKFERRRDLLRLFLPSVLRFFAHRPELNAYEPFVPVPADPGRRWQREFNQSSLIAHQIQKALKRRLGQNPRVVSGVLSKRYSTPPQSLLGREARGLNLEQVFRVRRPEPIKGRSLLLIDDIFTTGATLEEAARTLKEAGAERVAYFALSRAIRN